MILINADPRYAFSKEPYISAKKLYTSTKKLYISVGFRVGKQT